MYVYLEYDDKKINFSENEKQDSFPVEICGKCSSNQFYLNDSMYVKCINCGNDLTDTFIINEK